MTKESTGQPRGSLASICQRVHTRSQLGIIILGGSVLLGKTQFRQFLFHLLKQREKLRLEILLCYLGNNLLLSY